MIDQSRQALQIKLNRVQNTDMALPYPEGQVYFRRTALRLPTSPYNFDVQNDRTFYSHCLLENVWNTFAFTNWTTPSLGNIPSHPRSRVIRGRGQLYRTDFGKSHPFKLNPFHSRTRNLRGMGQDDCNVQQRSKRKELLQHSRT